MKIKRMYHKRLGRYLMLLATLLLVAGSYFHIQKVNEQKEELSFKIVKLKEKEESLLKDKKAVESSIKTVKSDVEIKEKELLDVTEKSKAKDVEKEELEKKLATLKNK